MTTQTEINAQLAEGESAFLAGKKNSENPYSLYTDRGQRWQRGYANAKYGKYLQSKINDRA